MQTRDEVARTVGIGSGRTYERVRKVIEQAEEEAPELVERMEAGELSAREARTDLRRRKGERRFAEAADAGDRPTALRLEQAPDL